jgi:hypothetical protein
MGDSQHMIPSEDATGKWLKFHVQQLSYVDAL